MKRPAATKHRPYDSLPVAAGGAAVPDPFSRIRASAIGITNLAQKLAQNDRLPQWARDEAVKIVLLSADTPEDIDAVKRLCECYETDLRELRNSGLRMAQEVNAMLPPHNDEASKSAPLPIPLTREPHRAASGE